MQKFLLVSTAILLAFPAYEVNADELFVKKKVEKEKEEETLKNDGNLKDDKEAESSDTVTQKKEKNQVFVPKKPKYKPMTSKEVDQVVLIHTQEIGAYCVGAWQTQKCVKALARSNMNLASIYAEKLELNGKKEFQKPLLNDCAASTAALKQEVPAYAMKSAMTTCANTISDITDATKIKPNLTHFQLLVEPIFCLGGEERCEKLENTLRETLSVMQEKKRAEK